MKHLLSLIFIIFSLTAFAQQGIEINNTGQLKLLGHVNKERLEIKPFDSWYTPNYDTFLVEKQPLTKVKKALRNVDSIKVFFGTWCGDSKREVPKFIKILEQSGYSEYELIGLDNTFQNYKQSPFGEEMGLGIHRVPTFIFYQEDKEIGRIVEHSVASFEEDILQLVSGDSYTPNYEIANVVQQLIRDKGSDYVLFHADSLAKDLAPIAVKVSELNTLAFKLFTSFEIEASEAVYVLNKLIFKEEYYPYYSLGRYYLRIGNEKLAKLSFTEGLVLHPDNEDLKNQLAKL